MEQQTFVPPPPGGEGRELKGEYPRQRGGGFPPKDDKEESTYICQTNLCNAKP